MRIKILLFTVFLTGCFVADAKNDEPGNEIGKKKSDSMLGVVTSAESKKPVKDVTVTAILDSKKEKKVQTDEDGNYSFDDLKPGTYNFIFEKKGFRKLTRQCILIKIDDSMKMDIELADSPDYNIMPTPFHFSDF